MNLGGNLGKAILPYQYKISEAWGVSLDKNNIIKPKFNIIRLLAQKIINLIKGGLKKWR